MNSDFGDSFGGPADPYAGYQQGVDPLLIMLLIVFAIVLAGFVGLVIYMGRQRGYKRLMADRAASAEAIYDSVRFHLDQALKSPGGAVLERGREVAEVIEARLGYVLALKNRPGKLIEGLDKALAGEKPKPAPDPAPLKVKVPLPTETHYLEVWKALQELNRLWDDKPRIMAMIEAAQSELSQRPPNEKAHEARKAAQVPVADTVAVAIDAALADADHAGQAGQAGEAADRALPPDPDPDPPKPRKKRRDKTDDDGKNTGGKRKSGLPPHKRNMLA